MRLICMILGTILTVLLIVRMIRGAKYDSLTEVLEGSDYPLKGLYGVGFSWNDTKLLHLKGKMREQLVGEAKLLYDPRYAEYYATVTWAQAITMGHLFLALGLLFAGLMNSVLYAVIGVAAAGVFVYYFLGRMKTQLQERQADCTVELPEIVSTMALLVNSGMVLREAWSTVAFSKEGKIYTLMRGACADMENGMSDMDAILKFSALSNTPEVKKFASALVQGMEKGSSDLSNMLAEQSSEMWNLKRQVMLQKGEAAATKLLIPTVLIFLGIIILVIAGAVGMLM